MQQTDAEVAVPRARFNLPAPRSEPVTFLDGGEFTLLFLAAVPALKLIILPVALRKSEICRCLIPCPESQTPSLRYAGENPAHVDSKERKLLVGVLRQVTRFKAGALLSQTETEWITIYTHAQSDVEQSQLHACTCMNAKPSTHHIGVSKSA